MSTSTIFCCTGVKPYKSRTLDHEAKSTAFVTWADGADPGLTPVFLSAAEFLEQPDKYPYIVQLVRQVNFGPLESKRYFAYEKNTSSTFVEASKNELIQANFQKLNSYKNFKCTTHNKFFEVNLYKRDPVNKHHWRADIARPADQIDIPASTSKQQPIQQMTASETATDKETAKENNQNQDKDTLQEPERALQQAEPKETEAGTSQPHEWDESKPSRFPTASIREGKLNNQTTASGGSEAAQDEYLENMNHYEDEESDEGWGGCEGYQE